MRRALQQSASTIIIAAISPTILEMEAAPGRGNLSSIVNQVGSIGTIASLIRDEYRTPATAAWPAAVISEHTLQNDTIEGRPTIVRWEWGGVGGAHYVIISGYRSEDAEPYDVLVPRTTTTIKRSKTYVALVQGTDPDVGSYGWSGYVTNISR